MVTISRGDVVICDLNPVVGTEQVLLTDSGDRQMFDHQGSWSSGRFLY